MVGAAQECELQPALAGDGFDHSQRPSQCSPEPVLARCEIPRNPEYRFSTPAVESLQDSIQNLRWPCARKFLARPAGLASFIESADQCAAADEWRAETNSFLFGEANDFNSERKSSPIQSLQQRNRQHHAEHPVVSSGVGDRIEMRSQQQSRRFRFCSQDRTRANFRRRQFLPCPEPFRPSTQDFLVAIAHRRGKKSPPRAAGVFTEAWRAAGSGRSLLRSRCRPLSALH